MLALLANEKRRQRMNLCRREQEKRREGGKKKPNKRAWLIGADVPTTGRRGVPEALDARKDSSCVTGITPHHCCTFPALFKRISPLCRCRWDYVDKVGWTDTATVCRLVAVIAQSVLITVSISTGSKE